MNRFCLTPELTLLYTSLPQDIYMIDITQDITLTKKIGTIILITLGNFLKENTAKHAKNIAKQSTSASNIYVQNKDVNVTFEPNKIAMQIPCTLLKLKSLATNNTAMDTNKILDIPINQGVAKNLLLSKKG